MGLGGGLGVLPGISSMGASLSIGSLCGVDRAYGLSMALLMNLGLQIGYLVLDLLALLSGGGEAFGLAMLLRYLFTAGVSFGGSYLSIKLMRSLAGSWGYAFFCFYCWGVAFLTFVLNLMA